LLRWQWLAVALFYGLAIALAYNALPVAWRRADDHLWLAMACGVASMQLAIFWVALPFNYSKESNRLVEWLGLANWLTLTRGMLVTLLAGFIFAPMPWGWMAWIPAVLYGMERVVDLLDGYVARITHRESRLGAILDMEFDGLGILIASAVAIQYGKIPAWYLLLGLARPLFVAGIWVRQQMGWRVHPLAESDLRRIVAGVQTAFVAVVLAPVLPSELTRFATYLFAIPLVASFVRDWLVVSDTLDAANPVYLRVRSRAKWWVEGVLPVPARWIAGAIALWLAISAPWGFSGSPTLWWLTLLAMASGVALMVGAASRVAAMLVIVVACADVVFGGIYPHDLILVFCSGFILHVGGGKFTLWSPEERYVRTPLGA
jgi:CDP-diacylglycerol--glycerol-3-phosphate 3-phosphatidyltransferase